MHLVNRGCSFKDIIAALRERGIVGDFERSWTYPPDGKGFQKVVTRTDSVVRIPADSI